MYFLSQRNKDLKRCMYLFDIIHRKRLFHSTKKIIKLCQSVYPSRISHIDGRTSWEYTRTFRTIVEPSLDRPLPSFSSVRHHRNNNAEKSSTEIGTTSQNITLENLEQWCQNKEVGWKDIFDMLPSIKGSSKYNRCLKALRSYPIEDGVLPFLLQMENQSIPRDVISYNTVLAACAEKGACHEALQLLSKMQTLQSPPPNVISYSTVIRACSKKGEWRQALKVFFQAYQDPDFKADIKIYNTVLAACSKGKQGHTALKIFHHMEKEKIRPDLVSFNTLINVLEKDKKVTEVCSVYEKMQQCSIAPDIITYSSLSQVHVAIGQFNTTLTLLDEMIDKKIYPTIRMYNGLLNSCKIYRKTEYGDTIDIVTDANRDDLINMSLTENMVNADACRKMVFTVFSRMQSQSIVPDGYSYTSAISACASWSCTYYFLQEMRLLNIPNDSPTYHVAILTASWENALQLYESMGSLASENSKYHLMEVLGQQYKWDILFSFCNPDHDTRGCNIILHAITQYLDKMKDSDHPDRQKLIDLGLQLFGAIRQPSNVSFDSIIGLIEPYDAKTAVQIYAHGLKKHQENTSKTPLVPDPRQPLDEDRQILDFHDYSLSLARTALRYFIRPQSLVICGKGLHSPDGGVLVYELRDLILEYPEYKVVEVNGSNRGRFWILSSDPNAPRQKGIKTL